MSAFGPKEIVYALPGSREVRFKSQKGENLAGFKTPREIISLAISEDGTMIATGEKEYGLHLWDRKGTLIRKFSGLKDWAGDLAFSPDGKTLASGGSWWSETEAEIILWATDGSGHIVPEEKQRAGIHLAYSPGGEYLLSGSFQQNKLILWDNKGRDIHTYSRNMEFGNRFIFCGDYIISIKREEMEYMSPGVLQIWSIDGTFLSTLSFPEHDCYSLAAIPGTSHIVIGQINLTDNSHSLKFVDLIDYKHTLKRNEAGTIIFNNQDYIPPVVFELQPPIAIQSGSPLSGFSSISISKDEKQLLAIGYDDGTKLQLWNFFGESMGTFTIKDGYIDDVLYAPSGQHFLSIGEFLYLWSPKGELPATLPTDRPYLGAAFLAGDKIIAGSYPGAKDPKESRGLVYLFDKNRRMIKELARTSEIFRGLNADSSGEHFLCYGEKNVFLYDSDGTQLAIMKNFPGDIDYSTFLGNRREILVIYMTKSGNSSASVWCGVYDFTGKFLRRFKLNNKNDSISLAVSPDGNYIACRFFATIKVFSPFGTLIEENPDPTQSMDWAIRFSPGGKYLVCNVTSEEKGLPLKIWEVKVK